MPQGTHVRQQYRESALNIPPIFQPQKFPSFCFQEALSEFSFYTLSCTAGQY